MGGWLTCGVLWGVVRHKHFSGVHGLRVSWWGLFKLNVWRGLLQTRRDLLSFGLWGVAMTVIGFIFGILYLGQVPTNHLLSLKSSSGRPCMRG